MSEIGTIFARVSYLWLIPSFAAGQLLLLFTFPIIVTIFDWNQSNICQSRVSSIFATNFQLFASVGAVLIALPFSVILGAIFLYASKNPLRAINSWINKKVLGGLRKQKIEESLSLEELRKYDLDKQKKYLVDADFDKQEDFLKNIVWEHLCYTCEYFFITALHLSFRV